MTTLLPLMPGSPAGLDERSSRSISSTGMGFAALLATPAASGLGNPHGAMSFDSGLFPVAAFGTKPAWQPLGASPETGTNSAGGTRQNSAYAAPGQAAPSGALSVAIANDALIRAGQLPSILSQAFPSGEGAAQVGASWGANTPTFAVDIKAIGSTGPQTPIPTPQPAATLVSLLATTGMEEEPVAASDGNEAGSPHLPKETDGRVAEGSHQVNLVDGEDGLIVSFVDSGKQGITIGQLQDIAARIMMEFNVDTASLAYKAGRMPIGKQRYQGAGHGDSSR